MTASNSPTIQDIARQVGVSKVAVSVVLNGSTSNTRVSAETRQRILAAAAAMNYQPNVAAQGLTRGRMNTIGVMFGFTDDAAPIMSRSLAVDILQGVSMASEKADYNLMLFTRSWRKNALGVQRICDQRTDGIVVSMPPTEGDFLNQLMAQQQPLVFIGYPADAHGIPSVDVDNAAGVAMATEHLLQLGHRRIAYMKGDDFYVCTGQRLSGFLQTMLKAGIISPPEYLTQSSYDGKSAAVDAQHLLTLPNPPTAILTGNDYVAMHVIQTAQEMGIEVPTQLSVVGFDDINLSPMEASLTTVRQPFIEMGTLAAQLLFQRLNGDEVPAKTHLLEHTLMVRRTTAPPRKEKGF